MKKSSEDDFSSSLPAAYNNMMRLFVSRYCFFRYIDNMLNREAKLVKEQRTRCGSAEAFHADRRTIKANVSAPAEVSQCFDCYAGTNSLRQNALFIFSSLLLEEIHARHRYNADINASRSLRPRHSCSKNKLSPSS